MTQTTPHMTQTTPNMTQTNPTKVDQRSPRKIANRSGRSEELGGDWPSSGGWGEERLAGWEDDMSCDVDQFDADEITADEIFNNYISTASPVLIRGYLRDWPALQVYSKDGLVSAQFSLVMLSSLVQWHFPLFFSDK